MLLIKSKRKSIGRCRKANRYAYCSNFPKSLNIEDLDSELVEREREVLIDQAMSSGKPKEIAEKMVQGRLQKFFQDVVLNEQISVIDGETKIKDVINKLSKDLGTEVKISDFKILKLGEGIEVAENDFAAEVAATANKN